MMSQELAQQGWGVVVTDFTLLPALQPLLDWRKAQAAAQFQILEYQSGEGWSQFSQRHGKLPYYLLLVGNPQQISFQFQQLANIRYAVGRLDFTLPEDYTRYAHQVVAAESGQGHIKREIALQTRFEPNTIGEVFEHVVEYLPHKHPTWAITAAATQPALRFTIGSKELPTATLGQIIIYFGNNTVGTPKYNEATSPRTLLTEHPCTTPTAQEALRQGALAILGNVGPIWGQYTVQPRATTYIPPLATFESLFDRLLTGQPIGHACEFLGQRYAELSTDYKEMQDNLQLGEVYPAAEVTQLRQAKIEAGSWQLLGDPACYLKV